MDLITENMVSFDEDEDSTDSVFRRIAQILKSEGRVLNADMIFEDLKEREGIIPTAMGDGIAIPHALSDAVLTESIVILRLTNPIQWTKEEQVKHVFSIAVPKSNANQVHLKILSNLARQLLDDKIRKVLFTSKSKRQIIDQILRTTV
jgi:fructose-specific phosphotransferase system IIA component